MTEKVAATFDKCFISDRNAVRILIAVAEACGCEIDNLIINKTSICYYRQQFRQKLAENIKTIFGTSELTAAVLHWDGKLLQQMLYVQKVDRMAIIISNEGNEQILSIPALKSGTGIVQATAIVEVTFMKHKCLKLCFILQVFTNQ